MRSPRAHCDRKVGSAWCGWVRSPLLHHHGSLLGLDGPITTCIDLSTREEYRQLMELKEGNPEWAAYSTVMDQYRLSAPFHQQSDFEEFRAQLLPLPEPSTGDRGGAARVLSDVQLLLHHLIHASSTVCAPARPGPTP